MNDDQCHCPQCAESEGRPDFEYLWQFFLWIQKIDPAVIEHFEAAYGDNELTMN